MPRMSDEVEVKIPVPSLDRVRRSLRRAGARYLGTVVQTDRYFDTRNKLLLKADCGLRIRQVRVLRSGRNRIDRRALLTYKGPMRPGRGAKVRQEIQARIDDAEVLAEILTSWGLRHVLMVQKRRASYRLGACRVELDLLPMIGSFVEVEGPGTRQIVRLCRKLSLPGGHSKTHYVRLLADACVRVGRECLNVTLADCKPSCPRRRKPSGGRVAVRGSK